MKFHQLFAVASMILGRGECATQREVKSTCRFGQENYEVSHQSVLPNW